MEQAETWAAANDVTAIESGVYEFNQAAQEFYRGPGYTTFHWRKNKSLQTPQPNSALCLLAP
jgi:hypothetical protein